MALLVLSFHQVSEQFDPRIHYAPTWTELARFRDGMRWLEERAEVVPLCSGIEALEAGESENLQISLTFDDGYASVRQAVSVLGELGLPATFFINSAYLGSGKAHWYSVFQYLKHSPGKGALLSSDLESAFGQLRRTLDPEFYRRFRRELEALSHHIEDSREIFVDREFLLDLDGVSFHVGLHGHEHQRFSMMPVSWQAWALDENVRELEHLRSYRPIFAVPFGKPIDWTEDTLRLSHERGLKVVLADGGMNTRAAPAYARQPADNLDLRPLVERVESKLLAPS